MTLIKISITLLVFLLVVVNLIFFSIKPMLLDGYRAVFVILWLNVLVCLNWIVTVFLIPGAKQKSGLTLFGVVPALGFITLLYSFLSLVVLFWFLQKENYGELPNTHWTTQFVLFGLFGSVFLLSLVAVKTAELPIKSDELPEKSALLRVIVRMRIKLGAGDAQVLISKLDLLADSIKYAIPHLATLSDEDAYKDFSREVLGLGDRPDPRLFTSEEIDRLVMMARSCK